jgi:enoyl-CoA hydratase/carnithine racemase
MVFHCDYVIASTTATFSSPFIQCGLVPEGASSLLLPRMVGHQLAFSMLVMGRPMSAEVARTAGFVNTVVPPAMPSSRPERWRARFVRCRRTPSQSLASY